ncbi:MAG: hypothetical protein JSW50_00855 [Candidatus Latescibacterota bacterium]|nr:MAG: hypothetical protein JSW50_00855 [Candidatus Latescibacterota bacterium]
MAKTKKTPSPQIPPWSNPYIIVGVVAVAAVVCFFPVTKYFFLQDDFILLEDAAFKPNTAFAAVFESNPGLFRPLTKVAYFAAMYKWAGLNPLPYHIVSLLLHVINIFLFFHLLRRFKIGAQGAMIVTALFALNVAFLDVLAWICCVQQLAALMFLLLGLHWGVRAIETKSIKFILPAIGVYVLALMSMEQTYALALILFLYAFQHTKTGGFQTRLRTAAIDTAPFLAVMLLYFIFFLGWKGLPGGGPYQLHIGANVVSNILTYLDWVFDLSVVMPFVTDVAGSGLTATHLVIVGLVAYGLARGREQIVVFALSFYFLTLLPVLFLDKHAFYLHNYIPSFGIFLLLAPVAQDLYELLENRHPGYGRGVAVLFVLLIAIMSFTKIRFNETNILREDIRLPKNFVLRRAVIARNAYEDITSKTDTRRQPRQLFMVFKDRSGWYRDNVTAALGKASAPRLFYSSPAMAVFYHDWGDTLHTYDPNNSVMLFFDHTGHCFTSEEIEADGRGATQILEPR